MASLNDVSTRTGNLEKNKLNISGGTLTGSLSFNGIGNNNLIRGGSKDGAVTTTDSTDGANLIIQSWYGVGFRTSCGNCGTTGTTLAIDTRSGNLITLGSITANKVFNAVWNDYAEYFPKGEDTEAGDIIALDIASSKEQYIKADYNSKRVVGVHSDTYGHLIGGDEIPNGDHIIENNKKYIPIGLSGRVYVKVKGKVNLGDYIVPSNEKGIGRALNEDIEPLKNIVGYVVETDNRTDIRRVKIFITNGDR